MRVDGLVRNGLNRRLRQRRPLRARVPSFGQVSGWVGSVLRRAAPLLFRASILIAVAGIGGATYVWLQRSPRFAVREIVIDGNRHVAREDLLRRAGVRDGRNIFTLSPRRIERALSGDPWIASVEVRRRLPDRLDIHVTERQPAALVSVDGAGIYLADAGGRLFKRAALDEGDGEGLIVVSGLPRVIFADPERAAALVKHAMRVAGLWQSPVRPTAGEIHLGREGVTLRTLEGGVAVILGRGDEDNLKAALRRFDAIWNALPAGERVRARRIHLDSFTRPDRVTVSLANTR